MSTVASPRHPHEATTPPAPVPGEAPPASGAGNLLDTRWPWLVVLGAAVLTRFLMVGEWSLWRDEERSIFFSQDLGRAFPASFPLFFLMLRGLFEYTGVSVLAARTLAAGLGVLSIVLVFVFVTRLISRSVGIFAAAFVTMSLGHLFWSQSIRYYTLLLIFQLASVYCFLNGLETGRLRQLAAASLFLFLGVLSHLSAALLFPVFVVHIALSILVGERGKGYNWKTYASFAAPFAVVAIFLLTRYAQFNSRLSAIIATSSGVPLLPLFLVIKIVGYFGPAAVLLSVAAPFVGAGIVPQRLLRFFVCLSLVPVLELMATNKLGVAFPLWYQALIAGVGFSVLAAITLYSLRQRGYLILYRIAICAAVAVSLPPLYGYYTSMYGDRPRWKEAAHFIQTSLDTSPGATLDGSLFSTNREVVAFYLGSPQWMTANHLVRFLPPVPPDPGEVEQWFVVESDETPPHYQMWLAEQCQLVATFEAWTGPKNRTLSVYRRSAAEGPSR